MKRTALLIALLAGALLRADGGVPEAAALVNQGRYADAARAYEKLIAQDPGNASLHHSLGLCYQALREYPRAISSLERAVALSPDPAEPAYSLALLHEALAQQGDRGPHLAAARDAWRKVAATAHGERAETAARHLEKISDALDGGR